MVGFGSSPGTLGCGLCVEGPGWELSPGCCSLPWHCFGVASSKFLPSPGLLIPPLCQPCLISDLLGAKPRLCVHNRPGSCWEPRRLHPKTTRASKSSPAIPVSTQMGKASPAPRGISPSTCSAAGLCPHIGVHRLGDISRPTGARAASGAASRRDGGGRARNTPLEQLQPGYPELE